MPDNPVLRSSLSLYMMSAGCLEKARQARAAHGDPSGAAAHPAVAMLDDGVAVIRMGGPIFKDSPFRDEVDPVRMTAAVNAAAVDDSVRGVLMVIDSPGGTVAGSFELADAIAALAQAKPVRAHIDDMGASAAYLLASQVGPGRLSANRTAIVGSLGTISALVDSSGAFEDMGLKVIPIATGIHKTTGMPGVPIADEQVESERRIVTDINEHFIAAVRNGRGFSDERTRELFDGAAYSADRALQLGLIDTIGSMSAAISTLTQEVHTMDRTQFMEYASQNPQDLAEASAALIGTESAKAVASERKRCADIQQAFGSDDPVFCAAQIGEGRTLAEAKMAAFDQLKASRSADKSKIAELEKKIQQAAAQAQVKSHDGIDPISVGAISGGGDEPDPNADPHAHAAWEFDHGKAAFKTATKDHYIRARVSGRSGTMSLVG